MSSEQARKKILNSTASPITSINYVRTRDTEPDGARDEQRDEESHGEKKKENVREDRLCNFIHGIPTKGGMSRAVQSRWEAWECTHITCTIIGAARRK